MRLSKTSLPKISRPRMAGVLPRKRLFRLFDRGRDRPVIWISAPAGSGKTTLVASYLESRKLPCIWYQVDEGDSDTATFFYYMGLAAMKPAPRRKKPLPLLTPEYLPVIQTFTRRFFEEFYGRLKTPYYIVFDNYHEAPDESPLHDIIRIGMSAMPAGISVIVLSRTEPPSQMARLLAGGGMGLITRDEIRFSEEETRDMIRINAKTRISGDIYKHVYEMTEGWAAGIVLMMERQRLENWEMPQLKSHAPDQIFDYFASEIFMKIDRETRNFLLKTAFLPIITPQSAERLTGNRQSLKILSNLNRRNYFTEKLHHAEHAYQYHPLFRRFLLERAKNAFGDKESRDIERRAAELLEESGEIQEAAVLFIQAGDEQRLAGLIMKHAGPLLLQGRNRVVEAWIRGLPEKTVQESPWLLYWLGACRMPYDQNEALGFFEKAFGLFDAGKNKEGVFLAWAAIAGAIFFSFEDLKRFDGYIAILEDMIGKYGAVPPGEIDAAVSAWMMVALIFRGADHPAFNHWKEHALSVINNVPDGNTRILCMGQYLSYRILYGDFDGSFRMLRQMNEMIRRCDCGVLVRIQAKLIETMPHMLSARHEECLRVAEEGLALAEKSGIHTLDVMLMGQIVWCSITMSMPDVARKFLERMEASHGKERAWGDGFHHFVSAFEALERKDLGRASHHIREAHALSKKVGAGTSNYWSSMLFAMTLEELGERDAAIRQFDEARDFAARCNSPYFTFDYLLSETWFLFRQERETEGMSSLKNVLRMGSEHGFPTSFTWRNSAFGPLLARALSEGIEADYVRDLIRRHRMIPEGTAQSIEQWPWPVKIYSMGAFSVIIDDKPLRFSGKVQKKPLELLKAIIAFGGIDIPEIKLTSALWPDAEGDTAQWSLKTTLKRLRKLLGNDQVIMHHEGKVSLDQRYCWNDVRAFENLILETETGGSGETGKGKGRVGETEKKPLSPFHRFPDSPIHRTLERAISLYRGHFLSGDEDKPWALSMRERLRARYLQAVEKLGTILEDSGKYKSAAAVYEKGLEIEDVAEELYRRLMQCHQRMGRRAEALKVYERCRKVLTGQLGIEPSDDVSALAESIREERK